MNFGFNNMTQLEREYALSLSTRIQDYLVGKENAAKPTNEEIASGMFLHCLIVALDRITALNGELKKIEKEKFEEIEERTISQMKLSYTHRHHEDIESQDEEYEFFKNQQKQLIKLVKAEIDGFEFKDLMDPESLMLKDTEFTTTFADVVERASNLLDTKDRYLDTNSFKARRLEP